MPAGTPGWGTVGLGSRGAQVWRLGRATECRLASDWAQGGAGDGDGVGVTGVRVFRPVEGSIPQRAASAGL